ncbi:unnamed protein product, partial [Tetraodon nigroviridis]
AYLCPGRGGEAAETGPVQNGERKEAASGEAHRSGEGRTPPLRYLVFITCHGLHTAPIFRQIVCFFFCDFFL